MTLLYKIQAIDPGTIDIEDTTYRLSCWEEEPSEELLNSIQNNGIIHPPILLQKEKKYIIIAGRKRIFAALSCFSKQKIQCHVLPSNTEHKKICSILIEEKLTGPSLTYVEQIRLLELILQDASVKQTLPYLEKFGHKPQEHILESLLKLHSLSDKALLALHNGSITLNSAQKLLKHTPENQQFIVMLLTILRLGGSKQRKLIELTTELIMRENMPLEKILADCPLPNVSTVSENIPQYASALLSWLQEKCTPLSAKAENKFKQQVASLNLPSTLAIQHTQSFENTSVSLTITFDSWESLSRTLPAIQEICNQNDRSNEDNS